MTTDDAFWGSVVLFVVAFGFPAAVVWWANCEHKWSLTSKKRKNNVRQEAETR